jgi:signal transduction histidine kinase
VTDSRRVADEQAALRRVATLVARGVPPEDVFAAVTEEVGRVLRAEFAYMGRYELDAAVTHLASWTKAEQTAPFVRAHWRPEEEHVSAIVKRNGRPARTDDYAALSGRVGVIARDLGIRSAAAAPILVEDCIWGVMGIGSTAALPEDTEKRLASFTELVATAIANADSRAGLARLAEEQAALRRVATLVARGVPSEEVFAAVTEEVGQLLPVEAAYMGRYDPDASVTQLAGWTRGGWTVLDVGTRWPDTEGHVATAVRQTGRPARIDDYSDVPGRMGARARALGVRSGAAAPIIVEDRIWGMMGVGSKVELPQDTEARLASFTELVATAIANTESRAGLARLAEEQAALRRVATLVARGALPQEVFAAVTEEVGRLLQAHRAAMARYESDHTVTVLATWAAEGEHSGADPMAPHSWPLDGEDVASTIARTGRPARTDDYRNVPGPVAAFVRDELGITSTVGSPIAVEGRPWGGLFVHSKQPGEPLPHDTESRLTAFTELVATAIANADSRAELAASRVRIVAAADETRRRIERDLHDGAQQQLVTLALELRAAQAVVPPELGELDGELSRVVERLATLQDELREMGRGIHPAMLTELGLGGALKTLARRSPVPVELDVQAGVRLPEPLEVAAYYVVSEALTNAAKHAHATVVHVEAEAVDDALHLCVRDDGAGGAEPARGSGLIGLRDRVETLGGTITVQSQPGAGTSVRVELPLGV